MQRGGTKKKTENRTSHSDRSKAVSAGAQKIKKKSLALAGSKVCSTRAQKRNKKNLALAEVQGMQREGTRDGPCHTLPQAQNKILKSQSPRTFTI